jgi:cell division protein FtsI (penicillin-binding protein 3)
MVSRKNRPHAHKPARRFEARRALVLAGLMGFWMLALGARLYHLQIIQYGEFVARALRQQQRSIEIAPKRGTIYDRQGNALAMSVAVDSVFAVPTEIPDRELVAKMLAPVLKMDRDELRAKFSTFRSFCWVKRKVSAEEAERVRSLNLRGVYFQKEMKRFYPKGDLAAHVLGHVGIDEDGLAGLEYGLNDQIQGKPGKVLLVTDARRQSFRSSEYPGQPGKDVVLTVDSTIQYIAEKALAGAVGQWKATGGSVVVLASKTGDILAMANQPTFNPNQVARSRPESRINRAIHWIYEPGSTLKVVTVSAALEENLTRLDEVIYCQKGSIVLAGHRINDHKPFGDLTVRQVVANSSNVGAIKLGLRLGEERLYRYVRNFGFGAPTGVGLPGEERGLLKPPTRWSGITIGEMAIGHEIGVTALQMAAAYSAIANGGVLFQPRIVRGIGQGDRREISPPPIGRRVLSERTASEMRRIFTSVIEEGSGRRARLAGYSAAGKTGTAQKVGDSGTYSTSHFMSSFVGFAPAQEPAVTILVVIDTPVGAHRGSEVAAPVFRAIAEQTLGYLNVPQDNPSRWLQVASSAPAGSPQNVEGGWAGIPPLASERPGVATSSLREVSFSRPSPKDYAETVVLEDGPGVAVPNFSGLSLREAVELCQRLGLEISVQGSGLAVEQSPSAGKRLSPGSRVWVRFSR